MRSLLVLKLVWLLLMFSSGSSSAKPGRFCKNEACTVLSATLLLNVNSSANPCDNFYEYACGNFQRQASYDANDDTEAYTDATRRMAVVMENRLHEILIDASLDRPSEEWNLREAVRLTRALYKNCLHWGVVKSTLPSDLEAQGRVAVENMNSLLNHLLGGDNWVTMSLEQLLSRTSAMGHSVLFDIGLLEETCQHGSANISSPEYVNAPKLVLIVSTFNFTTNPAYWKPMLNFLMLKNVSVSGLFNNNSVLGADAASTMTTIANEVRAIVESYQNLSQPFNGSLNALELELRASVPRFNLSLFLNELLPVGANKSTIVEVDNMPMLTALLGYFISDHTNLEMRQVQQVQRLAFLTLDAMLDFVDLLPAVSPSLKPRSASVSVKGRFAGSQCLDVTQRLMEPALVWLYRQRFHRTKLSILAKVIDAVKTAFVYRILHQDWITEADKAKIVDKVSDMRYNIGHQELTDKQLATFYKTTSAMLRERNIDNFGYTLGLAMKASAKQRLDLLTNSPLMKPSIFDIEHPFTVNAYYGLFTNSLTFPLAILTSPVYAPGFPDFGTYGAFGTLVGHEIGHGFAEQWVDNSGPMEPSTFMQLEPETQANYQQRVRCMQRDYAELKMSSYWNETLTEDIADNMGMSAAYRAYVAQRSVETDLLPNGLFDPLNIAASQGISFDHLGSDWQRQQLDRLFFVMVAQSYCTKASPEGLDDFFRSGGYSSGPIRVNGMMRNSWDFARTFQCPTASPMNPLVKCAFW